MSGKRKSYVTRSGLEISEVFSSVTALIKEGKGDEAIDLAYDLYYTSSYLLDCLWKELEKISICQIGLGEPYALSYVMSMRDICYDCENYTPESGGMQALSFIHAIRYLSMCEKQPQTEDVLFRLKECFSKEDYPVIPDFAYDHHNHQGRSKGHTPLDFLDSEGGSKVVPELAMAQPYKERLKALLMPLYSGENPQPFVASQYNHFYEMESVHGLNLELLQSAFQKSIRRQLMEDSWKLAYEGFLSGQEIEEYLWQRIVIMSVEDVGWGDPWCGRLMYDYFRVRTQFDDDAETRLLFLLQAVTYLCNCKKERSTELRKNILVQEYRAGKKPALWKTEF